ncbi:MAG: CidA/LrgA family protein [Bacteroidales bacterium]|nr:CidA/LrgA family protein [Bacteroidales bacterium]
MILQLLIIFGFLALGELVVWITGIKFPSCIIGMLMLTFSMKMGWIKEKWVSKISAFLLDNLGLFFVPPGVSLMLYFDLIKAEFWPIVMATLVSTIVVLVFSGWTHQIIRNLIRKKDDKDGDSEQ